MSGGSMNWLYRRLEQDATFAQDSAERKAFAEHLKLVAKALHDIEWVDCGDLVEGAEMPAVRACLGERANAFEKRLDSIVATAAEAGWRIDRPEDLGQAMQIEIDKLRAALEACHSQLGLMQSLYESDLKELDAECVESLRDALACGDAALQSPAEKGASRADPT